MCLENSMVLGDYDDEYKMAGRAGYSRLSRKSIEDDNYADYLIDLMREERE